MLLLLILLSQAISTNVLNASYLRNQLILLSFLVLFNTFDGVQKGILSGLKEFKTIALINIIQGVLTIGLTILLTFLMGLNGALLSLVLISFSGIIFNQIYLQRILKKT